jgi:DNA-binding NarL/FixJ family response regulator
MDLQLSSKRPHVLPSIIRIGIADDHVIVRASLKQFFSEQADMRVVGEAGSGRETIELARSSQLDVLVMDISMPGQNGFDVLPIIKARAPKLAILVLTVHPEDQYALPLIKHGASGFLNKQCGLQEILAAVRAVAHGHHYISPAVGQLLASTLDKHVDGLHENLSEREFQVFLKLAEGMKPNVIARELSLSPRTVTAHRGRLMKKLHLSTNSDLTYYAIKHKLIA